MIESNDYEWLLARERGEDVSHVPADTRDKYSRLDRLIQELPACAPSPGWRQRVLDSLDDPLVAGRPRIFPLATARTRIASPQASAPRPPRHWRWALGSGAASLAAVIAVCAIMAALEAPDRAPRGMSTEPVAESQGTVVPQAADPRGVRALFDDGSIEYLRAAAEESPTAPFVGTPLVGVRRVARRHRGEGSELNIGDTLVLQATTARPIELRVYGDTGEPLARCTETRGCRVQRIGDHRIVQLEIEARAPGAMRIMGYAGDAMPEPFMSLDKDLEAAGKASIAVKEISVVHVE